MDSGGKTQKNHNSPRLCLGVSIMGMAIGKDLTYDQLEYLIDIPILRYFLDFSPV